MSKNVQHSSALDAVGQILASIDPADTKNFLAHYGRKGMRWGQHLFTRNSGDGKSSGSSDSNSGDSSSSPSADTHLSADAERTLRTFQKSEHELSDREIREAVNRANQIKQYNELFGNKSELQRKVSQLQLEKQYKDLQRELNPPKKSAVDKFVSASASGFNAYKQINSTFDGKLSAALTKKLGLETPPSELDKLKATNVLLNEKKNNLSLTKEIEKLTPKPAKVENAWSAAQKRKAEVYNKYARESIKDARDLNDILAEVLTD